MSVFGISLKNNLEQQELARLILENDKHIIFCEGAAGTGKNFVTIATALDMVRDKKYKKIIYTRSMITVGEDIGFLPGDVDEKIDPYIMPLQDTIDSIVAHSTDKLNRNDLLNKFEISPIAFMRGRNIGDDTILIVDEAANSSLIEIQTLLTRLSEYSKIILIGSFKQIDNPKQARKEKCDFQRVMEAMKDLPYVGIVHLEKSMRSPWCREVDEICEQLKKTQ